MTDLSRTLGVLAIRPWT